MPTYLLHGFRWPRPLIRIHIILQNLDDAAAEWLMAPPTTATLIQNLSTLYPTAIASLPSLRFIEQYDPTDLSSDSKSQPFAYVADIVHEVKLGMDVDEMRGQGIPNDQWGAMVELRDAIAPGEKVAWWVVVCGDVERWAPPTVGLLNGTSAERSSSPPGGRDGWGGETGYYGSASSYNSVDGGRPQSSKGSIMRLFSRTSKELRKSKSLRTLRRSGSQASNGTNVPPLPTTPLPTTPLPATPLSSRPPLIDAQQRPGTAV